MTTHQEDPTSCGGHGAHGAITPECMHQPVHLADLSEEVEEAIRRALSRVHAAGMLHGEANPSNILLPFNGGLPKWAHLGSFGFSTDKEAHEIEIAIFLQELAV